MGRSVTERCRLGLPGRGNGRPRRGAKHVRCALTGALTLIVLVTAACSDLGSAPEDGAVIYDLVSPNGAEGGMLVEVTGATQRQPWSPGGRSMARESGDGLIVAIVQPEPGDIRLVVPVGDGDAEPEVRILQVVAPDNSLRMDLSAYTLRRVKR